MSASENDFQFSSDEARDMTYADARRFKMRFGEHVGRRLAVVAKTSSGRSYLKRLLEWKELRADTFAPIKIVLDEYNRQVEEREKKQRKKDIELVLDLMYLEARERDPENLPTFTFEQAAAKYEADMKKKEKKASPKKSPKKSPKRSKKPSKKSSKKRKSPAESEEEE